MPELSVRRLDPSLLDGWLDFFDRDAFADNPDWSGCYCQWFHVDHQSEDWKSRTADDNRRASIRMIGAGQLRGYLAYVEGRPVGWCQAASRLLIPNISNDADLAVGDAGEVGSIVCFAVASAFRKRGVAGRLLEAACAGFREEGLRIAEAYPSLTASGDAPNYHGPLALYLRAGFKPYRRLDTVVIVRRELVESPTVPVQ